MVRLGGASIKCLLLVALLVSQTAMAQQAFTPVTTSLIGVSYDRTPVDIEIALSPRIVPEGDRRDRKLRLRLERAFIGNFLFDDKNRPSVLSIGVNRATGLPASLVTVVAEPGPFRRDIPGVPVLAREERLVGHVRLNIDSDFSDASFTDYTERLAECVGEPQSDGLQELVRKERADCPRLTGGERKWLARDKGRNVAIISCRGNPQRRIGCSTYSGFGGFSVRIQFHESHLPQWRQVIEFAQAFLATKQIKP